MRFFEDSNFGKSDRRFYEDRLRSGRISTASGLTLDLAVVADGIGGENAGERAAEMTVEEVFEHARTSSETDIPLLLQTALEFANAKVYLEAQSERHKRDMGSTAALAAIHDRRLYIANIGDSRIYLLRGRSLRQLSFDHTFANEMIKQGELSREEAARHPRRDELMRSIGYEPQVSVDLGLYLQDGISEREARSAQGLPLRPGDRILLASDGLFKPRRSGGHYVEPEEMLSIVSEAPGQEAVRLLVDKALERKTDDNVSVVLMEVPDVRRPLRIPRAARIAFLTLLAIGLVILPLLVYILSSRQTPTLARNIQINQQQAYIAEIKDLDFSFLPRSDVAVPAAAREFIDFIPGALLQTGAGQSGYVFVGLPGRAELFLGPDTQVRLLSSASGFVVIQLDYGRAIINLREDFAGRRVTVLSAGGAHTWLDGSKMCLTYEPASKALRMDCVEDRCGYADTGGRLIQAGYHVTFRGARVIESGVGLQPEACQFVPGAVPLSTATITPTSTLVLSTAQVNATASAEATRRKLNSAIQTVVARSATPAPPHTATPSQLAPPTLPPTRAATWTPIPPTPTDTATIQPTDTDTPAPTDTPQPTDTDTPVPTDTLQPTDTPTEFVLQVASITATDAQFSLATSTSPPDATQASASDGTSTAAQTAVQATSQLAILDGSCNQHERLGCAAGSLSGGQPPAGTGGYFLVQMLTMLAIIFMPLVIVVRTVRLRA